MTDRGCGRLAWWSCVVLRFLRAHLTATGFLVLLAGAEVGYGLLSGHDQHVVRAWASTSVTNLESHPFGSLLTSAFLPSENPPAWLLLAALGMFSADGLLGWRRSLLLVATAQVAGTLISEGIVAWKVHNGALPHAALNLDDVGPSFIVVCALAFAVFYAWTGGERRRVRIARPLAGLTGLLLLRNDLFPGLSNLDPTAVGHSVSMLTGAVLGGALLYGRRRRSTRGRPAATAAREVRTDPKAATP